MHVNQNLEISLNISGTGIYPYRLIFENFWWGYPSFIGALFLFFFQ